MSVRVCLFGCLVFFFVSAPARAALQDTPSELPSSDDTSPSLKHLSIEELSRIAVLSASRRTETVSETAASITVITSDAIRRAGVTNLPDALRLAVGVAVAREGHAWAISARGFLSSTANKMAVFVDGRSVYTPLFSGVFWDAQDVLLTDVDRIEVIRGAGGTLWGANAVNGVINVITKLAGDTPGLLVQGGAGNQARIASVRFGGAAGVSGAYRVYGKFRQFDSQPYLSGATPDEPLRAGQAGFRVDLGPASRTSTTVQGDVFTGRTHVSGAPAIDAGGGNLLARVRHTFASGSQLQVQAYFDRTYRQPPQYTERRYTGDAELQYRFSVGRRHDIVSGVGYNASHDRVSSSAVLHFDPPSRTISLTNVFVQDEIALSPGRLALIAGSQFEHNSYTGFEVQPTLRLRWIRRPGQVLWGGISRAVRIPTRFDTDLRFTANTPTVVLTGSSDFRSEVVLAREGGIRILTIPKVAIGISGFFNTYSRLRTQEPTLPLGFPVVLGNRQSARVAGSEIGLQIEPSPRWQIGLGYTYLTERFQFDATSRDPTAGSSEHNDPAHQVWLRSFADLPGGFSADVIARWVAALPNPRVPAYAEVRLHMSRELGHGLALDVVGENLLHARHQEFAQLGPPHVVPRSAFLQLTWVLP